MIAYLNLIHGHDATAQLDNPRLPYRTPAAIKAAIQAWSAAEGAADANPETCEHTRGMLIIDQGGCVPANFRLAHLP